MGKISSSKVVVEAVVRKVVKDDFILALAKGGGFGGISVALALCVATIQAHLEHVVAEDWESTFKFQ
ncbi:hypothetical protein MKW98_022247, partial [Papaver atlanticum]